MYQEIINEWMTWKKEIKKKFTLKPEINKGNLNKKIMKMPMYRVGQKSRRGFNI